MKDLEKKLTKMLLHDSNKKIDEFNEICNYITQYSQANSFLIPVKYKETITNYLNELINNRIPIVYEFYETKDENIVNLTLFNFGAMQREKALEELKKYVKDTDNRQQGTG